MPLQGKQYSDLFRVFSELHKRGGVEDDQSKALPCYVYCRVPHTRGQTDTQLASK